MASHRRSASRGGARPWLYGVARKVLANRRRSEHRRDRLAERLAVEVGELLVHPTDAVPDQLWVRAALAALDDVEREVLTLSAWEGLTPTEIATVLQIPAVTVRTRLHRARARLRVQLEMMSDERSTSGEGAACLGRARIGKVGNLRFPR